MSRSIGSRFGATALFLCSTTTFFVLYLPAIFWQPAFDDWIWMVPIREFAIEHGWLAAIPRSFSTVTGIFWRPLNVLPESLAAVSLPFVLCLKIIGIYLVAWETILLARLAGLSRFVQYIVASAFLLHQCNVIDGVELDFWGDVLCASALYGLLAASWAYSLGRIPSRPYWLIAAFSSVIALLSKEAGVAAVLIPLASALIWPARNGGARIRDHFIAAALITALIALYLWVRLAIGAPLTSTDPVYHFQIWPNLPLNIILGVLFSFSPINTVGVVTGPLYWRIVAALWMVGTVGVFGIALRRFRLVDEWRRLLALVVLVYGLQGPAMLMPHLSEGNMIRSLVPALLFAAFMLTRIWQHSGSFVKSCIIMTVGLWMVVSTLAVHSKLGNLHDTHSRSTRFRQTVQALMPVPPPDRPVIFVVEKGPKGYSEFTMSIQSSIMGDADLGMRADYRGHQYNNRVIPVESLTDLPDSVANLPPDFLVSRDGKVHCLTCGRSD
jgi:hypothetical protein